MINGSKHLAFCISYSNASKSNMTYRFLRAGRRLSFYCQHPQNPGDLRFTTIRWNTEERGTRYNCKTAEIL